jgi:inosine/xanthosine triphosphatase
VLELTTIRRIAVGSANPVKLAAARAVFARVAPAAEVVAVEVPSGVPDQPFGDEETVRGARARAEAARRAAGAELGVGFEGGVVEEPDGGLRSCAWAAVAADGEVSVGGSLAMPLPPAIARRVRAGEELGHAVDAVTGERGTKHRGGAVGVLTGGLVDRQAAYEGILSYALARFLSPALWTD